MVGVKLYPSAIAYIDRLAQAEGVNRSEMIRRLLAEAVARRKAAQPGSQPGRP